MKVILKEVDNYNDANVQVNIVSNHAITLISLIMTIIIIIIIAGIGLNLALGENGLFSKTKYAAQETNKQTATEKINLKITSAQINTYSEEQRMPTLQELADALCNDKEIQYVTLKSQVANLDKITVGNATSIFTKLNNYKYEFEINSSLQLASIDGEKINKETNSEYVSKQEYDELKSELNQLKNEIKNSNIGFNKFEKVIEINKDVNNAGGKYYFTTDSNTNRNWNEEYFDYDSSKGFIAKKSGIYTVEFLGHTSSTIADTLKLEIKINNEWFEIAGRWNGNSTGRIAGTMTFYINAGDTISGCYTAPSGPNHYYNCRIFTFQ